MSNKSQHYFWGLIVIYRNKWEDGADFSVQFSSILIAYASTCCCCCYYCCSCCCCCCGGGCCCSLCSECQTPRPHVYYMSMRDRKRAKRYGKVVWKKKKADNRCMEMANYDSRGHCYPLTYFPWGQPRGQIEPQSIHTFSTTAQFMQSFPHKSRNCLSLSLALSKTPLGMIKHSMKLLTLFFHPSVR